MKLIYKSKPVTAEIERTQFGLGEVRYKVKRSDGTGEWLTQGELDRKYEPVHGDGWASVTRDGGDNA